MQKNCVIISHESITTIKQNLKNTKMNKKNVRFAFVVGMLCLGFLSDALAAPSVKRLGGAKTYVGTDKAVSAKSEKPAKTVGAGERTSTIQTSRSKTTEAISGVKGISGSGFSDTSQQN